MVKPYNSRLEVVLFKISPVQFSLRSVMFTGDELKHASPMSIVIGSSKLPRLLMLKVWLILFVSEEELLLGSIIGWQITIYSGTKVVLV